MIIIRVKLSSIVDFFCFLGCSIQIYHITCIYLEYKVRHEVTYDLANQVELPTIDIIIPMVMAINLTELFIRYPEQMNKLCQMHMHNNDNYTIENFNSQCSHEVKKSAFVACYNLAAFIKVKDINELTIDPREQIDYIQIGNAHVITDQCKLARYYNGLAIFLRISCTEQAALITDSMVDSYEGNIATLGHSLGSNFGIRFTDQVDIPVYKTSAYFMIIQKAEKKLSAWVRYEKMVLRSLPYPYETKCRYYNKLETLSDCIVNQSLHEGFLRGGIVNEWGSQPEHLNFDGDFADEEAIKRDCDQMTSTLECEKTTYIVDGEIELERVNHSSGLIFIEKPVTPIMYFNVHPELLLSEYLIFVGSIVGTWFGYSIFDRLIRTLTWAVSKVITKIRKSQESKRPIKIFTIRNSHNFSNPILRSTSKSSRCASSSSSIDTIKSIRRNLDSFNQIR